MDREVHNVTVNGWATSQAGLQDRRTPPDIYLMTFGTSVVTAYAAIVAVGLLAGCWLAARFPRRGGGGRGGDREAPRPTGGPSLAVDILPLGSAFDRQLLPGVFDEDVVALPT